MKLLVPDLSFPNTMKNRFYARLKLPNKNGCMEWIGCINKAGYGVLRADTNFNVLAHRYSYEIYYGKFSKKKLVLHKCDNPLCSSPDHLILGNQQDNKIDMLAKGRGNTFGKVKLNPDSIRLIRKRLSNGETCRSIAIDYKVCVKTINHVKLGITWSYIK